MQNINQEWLKKLSKEQIYQAGILLESIFVHQKPLTAFMDHQRIQVMASLIQAVDVLGMKKKLFESMSDQNKILVFQELEQESQIQLLEATPSGQKCFIMLSLSQKKKLLSHIRDDATRALFAQESSMQRNDVEKDDLQACIQDCITLIQIPSQEPLDLKQIFIKWNLVKYSEEELQHACQNLVAEFSVLKLPLNNPQQFWIYLKFFHICSLFHSVYPQILSLIDTAIQTLIMALSKMPTDEWLLKTALSIPTVILNHLISVLRKFSDIHEFDKKAMYSKLFKRLLEITKNKKPKKLIQAFQAQVNRQ
jgi:hypothetical protein